MTGSANELDSQLIRAIRARAFYFIRKPFDRELLLTVIDRCLELRRLASENKRYVGQLERNLEQARIFHRSLLPPTEACVAGTSIHARCEACSGLGGDIYDFAEADAGSAAIMVADVCGHGVVAAMLTGIVKSAFHWTKASRYDPLEVVRHVAGTTRSFGSDRFVTLLAARVSVADRTLEYVSAGHPPCVLWGPSRQTTMLESTGPLVSPAFPNFEWEKETVALNADDRLLLYTDGLTEAAGPAEAFGVDRLVRQAEKSIAGGEPLISDLLQAVEEHTMGKPDQDDITLLTANFA